MIIGGLYGRLTAQDLAVVFNDLFGGVIYAGLDTDKFKYPTSSGRVTFSNRLSYMKAVGAARVRIRSRKPNFGRTIHVTEAFTKYTLPTFEEVPKASSPGQIKKSPNHVKPSLDDVKDTSLVALTNKHGKGKYCFKSRCPTPDPRWSSKQQLMIGPIPGDVEYATLRSAFLSKGKFNKNLIYILII